MAQIKHNSLLILRVIIIAIHDNNENNVYLTTPSLFERSKIDKSLIAKIINAGITLSKFKYIENGMEALDNCKLLLLYSAGGN
ncbi:MAG TPA: hypothetical protein LFV90_07050 [Rickettsia endosymbiont of Columbicola hoogstraali]|nr:hypothetical protein [Rickettsia endosymbiont of Columbicola hoogstraali]